MQRYRDGTGWDTDFTLDPLGKVGIGTTTPQKTLHIEHAAGASEGILISGSSDTVGHTAGILLRAEGGEADSSYRAKGGIFFERTGTFGVGKLHLSTHTGADNSSANIGDANLTIDQNSVGIGSTSPSGYNSYANNLVVYDAAHAGITIATPAGDHHGSLYFADGTSGSEGYRGYLDYHHNDDTLSIGVGGTLIAEVESDGTWSLGGDNDTAKSGEKLMVRGPASHTSGRVVEGWWEGKPASGSGQDYLHLVTNNWGGGAPRNNDDYIMGGFWIEGYYYGVGNILAIHQYHPWGGSLAGYAVSDLGSVTGKTHVYVNSSGYVTLRLVTDSYLMYNIKFIQYSLYTLRTYTITAETYSNSATI